MLESCEPKRQFAYIYLVHIAGPCICWTLVKILWTKESVTSIISWTLVKILWTKESMTSIISWTLVKNLWTKEPVCLYLPCSHRWPMYLLAHEHLAEVHSSTQDPPFWQRLAEQDPWGLLRTHDVITPLLSLAAVTSSMSRPLTKKLWAQPTKSCDAMSPLYCRTSLMSFTPPMLRDCPVRKWFLK